MALTKTQVSALYVAIFNRASEGEGNEYWQGLDGSAADIATIMLAEDVSQEYFGDSLNSDKAFIEHIYLNTLGKTYEDDAEGIDYWVGLLEAGSERGAVIAALVEAAMDPQYEGTAAQLQFLNRVAVSDYTADTLYDVPENFGTVLGFGGDLVVTDDAATVETAKQAVDALVDGGSEEPGEPEVPGVEGEEFFLELGRDNLTGTDGDDTFTAYIENNSNTLQNGDVINGGAGEDTLYAEIGNSQNFAIQPRLNSVENVVISARTTSGQLIDDRTDNNLTEGRGVQIDAGQARGVTNWESNDSRADLIIEDVRINPTQVTKDVTITFRDSDPGNVDYAVYFDQQSLLSAAPETSNTLVLEISNPLEQRLGYDENAPLKDVPYTHFTFVLDGEEVTVALDLEDVTTYDGLEAALHDAFAEYPRISVSREENAKSFFSRDGQPREADLFTLTIENGTIEVSPGSGWNAEGGLPSDNAFSATVVQGLPEETDPLVTSTIVLDNVGRGSTGGDLVIGGLSAGNTSTSKGVQQFDITVEQSSKLQFLGSTADSLEVVNLVNDGNLHPDVINGKVVNQVGNLTIQGDVSAAGFGFNTAVGKPALGSDFRDQYLVGAIGQNSGFGLVNVREVNAEDFEGNISLTAQLNEGVVGKYMQLRDQAPNAAAADNVLFQYNLGSGNDSLALAISAANFAAAGTTTREDFELMIDSGAGDDVIEVAVYDGFEWDGVGSANNLADGNDENWYANSKLNANLAIDAGEGDDTVFTYGSGDWYIDLGTGDDVVYASVDTANDNAVWVFNAVSEFTDDDQVAIDAAQQALASAQAAAGVASAALNVALDASDFEPAELLTVGAFLLAQGELAVADAAETAAQAAYDAVFDPLELAVDNAQTDLDNADPADPAAVQTAQAALALAEAELAQAQVDNVALVEALAEAKAEAETAQAAFDAAEEAYDALELDPAEETDAAADVGTISPLLDALETANEAVVAAQQDLDNVLAAAAENALDIGDLASGQNTDFGPLFNSDLTVSFLGYEATVKLGVNVNTALEVNQAIKEAIQTDLVLSKLIAVQDGPANSLVIASLVDGVMVEEDLLVGITASTTPLSVSDVAEFNRVYSTGDTVATLTAKVNAAIANFNIDAGYVSNFANNGGVELSGANSSHVADNTINAGTGNDVIVLGTGENSNDTVVLEGLFGTNYVVHFQAGTLAEETGRDVLDFSSYGAEGIQIGTLVIGDVGAAVTTVGDSWLTMTATGNNTGEYTVTQTTVTAGEGANATVTVGVLDFGATSEGIYGHEVAFVEENFLI